MSIEQLVLIVLAAVVLAVVVSLAALATALTARREAADPGTAGPAGAGGGGTPRDARTADAAAAQAVPGAGTPIHRVVRIVSFLYLASVAVVVAVTGAWPDTQTAIFMLLALGTLLVVLFLDMLPEGWMGRARRPVEAVGALLFVGAITGLTGGVASPFYVGFFLVVAGTALSIEGRAPIIIAMTAALIYAFVGIVVSAPSVPRAEELGWLAFNTVALILLADIATVAGGIQRQAREEALRQSRFDPLTGLYNRSYLLTTIEQEIRRSTRQGRGFSLLMLDMDDLKPVNDTFGHPTGDRLLKSIADVIARTVRFTDAASRYGGDEFVVLLPETDASGAYIVAEKLRRDIGALSIRANDRNVRTSVSIGLVSFPDDGTTIEQLVAAVDVAMYEAKRHGKNQIVGYTTRTERVATAIEPERAVAIPLAPEAGVERGAYRAPAAFAAPGEPGPRDGAVPVLFGPAPRPGPVPSGAVPPGTIQAPPSEPPPPGTVESSPGPAAPHPEAAAVVPGTPGAVAWVTPVPGTVPAVVQGAGPADALGMAALAAAPAWPAAPSPVASAPAGAAPGTSVVGEAPWLTATAPAAPGSPTGAASSAPAAAWTRPGGRLGGSGHVPAAHEHGERRAEEVRGPESRGWIALPVDALEARSGEAREPEPPAG